MSFNSEHSESELSRLTSSLETQQTFRNVSQLTDKNGSREKYEAFAKAMLSSWWIAQ